jgi:hypothetical protein
MLHGVGYVIIILRFLLEFPLSVCAGNVGDRDSVLYPVTSRGMIIIPTVINIGQCSVIRSVLLS